MRKLIWQNSLGNEINLTKAPFGITNWEGFSNAPLNIQSQQVPMQDGSVFLDALIENRDLNVTVSIQDGNDLEKRYELERQLIHILNPKLGEGYLIYTNDFTSKRIKCIPQIPLFPNKNSNEPGTQKGELSWVACSPYWEDLEETEIDINLGEVIEATNNGDIPAQLEIDFFTNDVINPEIINIDTKKKIEYHEHLGENLHINTNMGKKEVVTKNTIYDVLSYNGNIQAVCYSKKLLYYIAVQGKFILKSLDGIKWERIVPNININGADIIYSDRLGLFILVRVGIYTSPDGENWTKQYTSNKELKAIAESDGLLITVGEEGIILTSSNGLDWTEQTSGVTSDLLGVEYKNQKYITVGWTGVILTSDNAISWTPQTSGVTSDLYSITWSELLTLYVIVGNNGTILTSPNLQTWTPQTSGQTSTLRKIVYAEDKNIFIVCGSSYAIISSDAINWTNVNGVSGINDIIYSEITGLFTCVNKYIYSSQNGTIWELVYGDLNTNNNLNKICYSEELDLYIMLAGSTTFGFSNQYVYTSKNLKDWTEIIYPFSSTYYCYDVIYSTKLHKFIILGELVTNVGFVLTSSDGVVWTRKLVANPLRAIIYSQKLNLFIAVGNGIYTSPNGENWTKQYTATELQDILYIDHLDLFIAVGHASSIVASSDGINWNSISNRNLTSISYSKDLNVIIGVYYYGTSSSRVYKSSDGINWIYISYFYTNFIEVMNTVYCEETKETIIMDSYGSIYTSNDILQWKQSSIGTGRVNDIIYSKQIQDYVYVGLNDGLTIRQTKSNENKIQNISVDSDMNLNIEIGLNKFRIARDVGEFSAKIKYRQKYIGV